MIYWGFGIEYVYIRSLINGVDMYSMLFVFSRCGMGEGVYHLNMVVYMVTYYNRKGELVNGVKECQCICKLVGMYGDATEDITNNIDLPFIPEHRNL